MILLVDDDTFFLETLRDILDMGGYQARAFSSAKEALEKGMGENYDLVVSDVMMPEINGVEFCRLFRADAGRSDTPFVFLTALGDKESLISGLDAGAVDYITKPINAGAFLRKVDTLIKGAKKKDTPFSILLVDHSPMILNVTSKKLGKAGFSVTTASNAEEAVELVHTRIFNLIISAVELKGMDGTAFCEKIKKSVFRQIPVVLFSGKIDGDLLEKSAAAGADDCWEKAISPEGLVAKVRAIARRGDFRSNFKGAMEGSLKEMTSVEVIQMFGMNGKTGILSLNGPLVEGHIHFNEGGIVDAATLMSKGKAAVYSLITLEGEGSFHFIPTTGETETVITEGFQGLLMEGIKILDDIKRIGQDVITLTGKKPDDLNREEKLLFSSLNGNSTLESVIKDIGIEPYLAFNTLASLAQKGLIAPPARDKKEDVDEIFDDFL